MSCLLCLPPSAHSPELSVLLLYSPRGPRVKGTHSCSYIWLSSLFSSTSRRNNPARTTLFTKPGNSEIHSGCGEASNSAHSDRSRPAAVCSSQPPVRRVAVSSLCEPSLIISNGTCSVNEKITRQRHTWCTTLASLWEVQVGWWRKRDWSDKSQTLPAEAQRLGCLGFRFQWLPGNEWERRRLRENRGGLGLSQGAMWNFWEFV